MTTTISTIAWEAARKIVPQQAVFTGATVPPGMAKMQFAEIRIATQHAARVIQDAIDEDRLAEPPVNERLLRALEGLMKDTQHAEHNCADEDCPVATARVVITEARAALAERKQPEPTGPQP